MAGTSDVLIIGGGAIGLAIALQLRQRQLTVTILSRDGGEAASLQAAGMLAPGAEALPPGPLLELCRRSLHRYPDWARKLEGLTGQEVGYWPSGILAPYYETPPDAANPASGSSVWLTGDTARQYQPGLSNAVVGAWWHPEDAHIDNRALTQALRIAVQDAGVDLQEGVTVQGLVPRQGRIEQIQATSGDYQADHYVLATGAWSNHLLPIPVFPKKGQMAAVQVPSGYGDPQPLRRVLHSHEGLYLVPRRNGRIVIGATGEDVGLTPGLTPSGLTHLFQKACRLYPPLREFPVTETWWGFRPATPDEAPILGASPWDNLTLATGHYRNGILLMPITAELVAGHVLGQTDPLLADFSWQRFEQSPAPGPQTVPQGTSPTLPMAPPHPPLSLPATPMAPVKTVHPPAATAAPEAATVQDAPLVIGGRSFQSRLMTGTGKYSNFEVMGQAIAASGCDIVTVAVRRVQTNAPGHEGLAEALDWQRIWMLPNTAGCKTAEEAVRVARLGREMAKLLGQEDNNFVKLEVIPDSKYLLPDPIGTLEAAEQLVKEGFAVLPYINADPLLAKRLEDAGCATVMPLGSPIGSGQGIRNAANIRIIIENAQIPVVVDAGIGTPSEAAEAMEMGASALLINTAIAKAQNPAAMGQAMGMATVAGRLAFLAGRIPIQAEAAASSPLTGRITD
jgi:thiazole synthase